MEYCTILVRFSLSDYPQRVVVRKMVVKNEGGVSRLWRIFSAKSVPYYVRLIIT